MKFLIWYICWLPPGGSNTVHIYTHNDTKQTIHRTIEKFGRVPAVPHLCGFYPSIRLTTEEKARKNLGQVSRRVAAGTMKIHKHIIRIQRHCNNNTQITVLNRNVTINKLIKNRSWRVSSIWGNLWKMKDYQ